MLSAKLLLLAAPGLITLLSTQICPALAQHAQVPATGYGTGESIQVSGWQSDLVSRNKGLEKFHWSAINTVAHYRIVPPGSVQKCSNTQSQQSHYIKPKVVSTWSTPNRELMASAASGNFSERGKSGNRLGQLNVPAASSDCTLGRSFSKATSNRPMQYDKSYSNQVAGHLFRY